MAYMFHDRARELDSLERCWTSPGPSLVMVWGRRRTGKTRLLGRFAENKRAIFYGATEQSADIELARFADATRAALRPTGADLLANGGFSDWESALRYLAAQAKRQRLLVVLDEFPYLVDSEPALPSIIQRFWDGQARTSKLKLVLCGSAVATMEGLQMRSAPLFGRIDARLQIHPFTFAGSSHFLPRLAASQRALAYGVVGGMPVYLQRWRDDRGHTANLRALFGDPESTLIDEGEFVLTSELSEASGYFRIMHGIAAGHRTYSKLRSFADIDIQRQLERLVSIGLVNKSVPVTEDPLRTKRVVYRIGDNFLTFWFRFIYRHRGDIARGLGREIVDRVILPGLPDHMGEPWEGMCRAWLVEQAAAGELPLRVDTVGRWWNADSSIEIDVVGMDGSRIVLVGSAKWAKTAGVRELERLRRAAEALPNRAEDLRFALFAREGFERNLPKDVLRFSARDLGRSA